MAVLAGPAPKIMKYLLNISLVMLLAAGCEYETERLDRYELHGIDVSHYQSYINWETIAAQGMTFAFIKATEGKSMIDTLFCRNWDQVKAAGLKRGAYHFFRPSLSSQIQANNFTFWVELQPGDLPPVLDVEVIDGVSKQQLLNGVKNWLETVEIHYGVKPILYTNLKFYNQLLAGHFDDYPIWIARYNDRQPTLACGRDWQFWQYGNRGRLDGIQGYVDFNVFYGTPRQLDSLCLSPRAVLSRAL